MSTQVFPTLVGQGWSITRTPMWQTRTQDAISGKETRLADWSYPQYQWELVFNLLRQGSFQGATWTEFQQLIGFYNQMKGSFDSFLYADQDDNAVTSQVIGTTDGVNTGFQAYRSFGGSTEPIFAINAVTALAVAGTPISGPYTFNPWGYTGASGGPGYIFLPSLYSAGQTITASFSYYWPCKFLKDQCDFEKFQAACYAVKQLTFQSIK